MEQFSICILYGHNSFLDFFKWAAHVSGWMCVRGGLSMNETESLIKSEDNQFG